MNIYNYDFYSILPIVFLAGLSLVVLILEAFIKKSAEVSFWVSLVGIAVDLVITTGRLLPTGDSFANMITQSGYGSFFGVLFLAGAFITIVLSREYLKKSNSDFGEFYLLILLATLGMMLMASAADLIVIFLGLELMSICLYVLVGFFRKRAKSNESSLKYFLLGAFSTGFLLYGIALVYGAAHTTNIAAIVKMLPVLSSLKMFLAGLGLILVGFAFKVAAVPFHMWVPDVYEGAPTTITGFMSTGAKAAAFAAFVLLFAYPYLPSTNLKIALSVIAAASMLIGNVVAISQSNIKRMLAYSSIAHAGYMLIGLAALNQLGKEGILFYIATYTFMNLGAFGIISLLEMDEDQNLSINDYAGLGTKKPFLAALMAIFMFSLSGIPPFGGFFGKYYIFIAAINANLAWLAIFGVMMSVIGVYYYLRIVVIMYFQNGNDEAIASPSFLSVMVITVAALAIIQLGVFPAYTLSIIQHLF
ncbi:MAG: NADH-quinone oxidoreductase subunit N [Bacteroidota bacterium]